MTGFGQGRFQGDHLIVSVEIRAVNNRYLKVSTKSPETYNVYEAEIEKLIREKIGRGTIYVTLRIERQSAPEDYRLNPVAIRSYLDQLRAMAPELGGRVPVEHVLALPGVVGESVVGNYEPMDDWPKVRIAVAQALDRLHTMRSQEGRAMRDQLLALRDQIATDLAKVAERAPIAVEAYRDRLHERVRTLLGQFDIELDRADLIREVSIFAERSDVSEEITRLRSHLDQFAHVLDETPSSGRKLEFLGQEMFREVNTIGSKASDVEISQHVVDMKGAIEKVRELTQNVE
jgi:uncharacterized protein (TIGR00255 family)